MMAESPAIAVGTAAFTIRPFCWPEGYQPTSDIAVIVAIGDEGRGLWAGFCHQGAQVEHLHEMKKQEAKMRYVLATTMRVIRLAAEKAKLKSCTYTCML